MRRVIRECQNNGRALEVRLEEESPAKYYVIIAGMTINLKSGCANGTFDATGEDEFLIIENDTYVVQPYSSYRSAIDAYEAVKRKYID